MTRLVNGKLVVEGFGVAKPQPRRRHKHVWYVNYGVTACGICGKPHPTDNPTTRKDTP